MREFEDLPDWIQHLWQGSEDNKVYMNTTIARKAEKLYEQKESLYEALEMALEWIDAVPSDTPLPTMPGFDRDWVDEMLSEVRGQ